MAFVHADVGTVLVFAGTPTVMHPAILIAATLALPLAMLAACAVAAAARPHVAGSLAFAPLPAVAAALQANSTVRLWFCPQRCSV